MRFPALFTAQSAVHLLIVIGVTFGAGAAEAETAAPRLLAQAAPAAPRTTTPAAPAISMGPTYDPRQTCDNKLTELAKSREALAAACSTGAENAAEIRKCRDEALKCKKQEQRAFEAISGDGTNEDTCREIAAEGCPELFRGSKTEQRQDKKEAKDKRKELEKERDQSTKDATEKAQKAQEEMNKLDDEAQKNDDDWKKNRKEITDKLQKDLADIDDAKVKSMKDAQEQYDKLDVEYIKMRDKLRRLTSTISGLELRWKVDCRATADGVARETEKQLNERMAAEDQVPKNYQMSSAAGLNRRRLKQKRKKILDMYNQTLNKCLRGEVSPGSGIKLEIDKAKSELHDEQSLSADAAARLEKLRLQIIESMKELEKSLDGKNKMIVQQAREALELLDQSHTTNSNRIAQRKQQAQQNSGTQAMQLAQAAQTIATQLKDAKTDEVNSSARAMCENITPGDSNARYNRAYAVVSGMDSICGSLQAIPNCLSDARNKEFCSAVLGAVRARNTAPPTGDRTNTTPRR